MKTKVLVTGGAGFIGKYLVEEIKDKYDVTIADNLSKKESSVPKGVKFIQVDLTNPIKTNEVFKDVDGVESSYISYDSCGSHKDGQFYGKTNGLQKVARDYFCKDDNKSSASTFVCEGDDVCISGICTDYNDISIICQDSDNGINEFVTGVTSLDIYVDGIVVSSTVATDSCSEDFLLENYCNENNLFDQNYIKCDDGCENGRCAATPTSATSFISRVRICISTSLPSRPATVV